MKIKSFDLIRISLSIVYVWFGILKLIGASPVKELVISTYPNFPEPVFLSFLGLWEVVIGVLFLFPKTIKIALVLMWFQMGGIFFGVFLNPGSYFQSMDLSLLSANGEFVVKNLVLLSASYYLWENLSNSSRKNGQKKS